MPRKFRAGFSCARSGIFCRVDGIFVLYILLQPLQVGSYYLYHGGTKDDCPYTSCSNAKAGQRYLPGFVSKGKCLKDNCPEVPPGFYFGRPGFCDLTRCTSGKRGTYYTQGCSVGACTNGNARSNPIRMSHTSLVIVSSGGIWCFICTFLGEHLVRCCLQSGRCNAYTALCCADNPSILTLDQKIAPNPSH